MSVYGTTIGNSATYKLKVPFNDLTVYFTIVGNNTFFVNCKDMTYFEHITALMTSYSRQINAGVDIASIIIDMKEAFDPKGPYIIPGTSIKVNSVIHHLGTILERHYNVGQLMETIDETNRKT